MVFNYSDVLRVTYSYQRDFKCSSSGRQQQFSGTRYLAVSA